MKKILLLLIFSALLMGCVSEKQQQEQQTMIPTPTEPVIVNESDVNETLSYLQEIENIDFNL